MPTGKFEDLKGQKIGRLTVTSRAPNGYYSNGNSFTRWNCVCECGNTVVRSSGNLKKAQKNNSGSCGCLRNEKISKARKTHGQRHSRLYNIWCGIKARCCNTKSVAYQNYGAKGIELCPEWHDFLPFYNWSMSSNYEDDLTIDRIDNSKGYSPYNCRWVTRKEQNRNKTNNAYHTYNGETKPLVEWAEQYGISSKVLNDRINKLKWDLERALLTPVRR